MSRFVHILIMVLLMVAGSRCMAAPPGIVESPTMHALVWLTAQQNPDGSWGKAPAAAGCTTALAVLAYLSAGETDQEGDHREAIAKGLKYLHQTGGSKPIAALALCEWHAATKQPRSAKQAQRAIDALGEQAWEKCDANLLYAALRLRS